MFFYLGVGDEKAIADSLFMFVVLDSPDTPELFFNLFGTLLSSTLVGLLSTPLSVLLNKYTVNINVTKSTYLVICVNLTSNDVD